MTSRVLAVLALSFTVGTSACGEALTGGGTPPSSPDASSPLPHGEGGAHDASSVDGSASDAGPTKGDSGGDAEPAADAAASCVDPTFPSGDQDLGCSRAVCPAGTVCVQKDSDLTSTARCVAIPPECKGVPTCACMGTEASSCVSSDPPPSLGCQDVTDGGATYLDFPCGCA